MRNIGFTLILFICLIGMGRPIKAQMKLTPDLQMIQDIMLGEIKLTREVHKDFWDNLNEKYSANDKHDYIQSFKKSQVFILLNFYDEMFKQAEESYNQGKVVESSKLINLEQELREVMLSSVKWTSQVNIDPELVERARSFANQLVNGVVKTKNRLLLQASEAKKRNALGEVMYIDLETIQSEREDILMQRARLEKLLNESYKFE